MGGFHHDNQSGGGGGEGDAQRGYSASFGDREHLQQHYHALRRSRSTQADKGATTSNSAVAAPPPRSLPGFATFLQQSPPHAECNSVASEHAAGSSVSRQRRPRDMHGYQQQLQRHLHHQRSDHQLQPSSAVSEFSTYSHLLDSIEDSIARTQSQRSLLIDASGGSPNLSDFKHIAINRTVSNCAAPSSYHIGGNGSSSSTASETARTHANYKPAANTSGVNIGVPSPQQQQNLPPARTSRYLREIDRRNILRRIEQGEKQANLAKEYQVSRAAISNLKQRRNNRNRKAQRLGGSARVLEEKREYNAHNSGSGNYLQLSEQFTRDRLVVSGSSNQTAHHYQEQQQHHHASFTTSEYADERYHSEDEQARSPSPVSSPFRASPYPEPELTLPMEAMLDRVIELKTTATEVLFTRLIDSHVDAQTKQTAKSRIVKLLLENAMGEFPTRDFQIPIASSTASGAPASYYLGTEWTQPTCAVKIVSECGNEVAAVLLREFQDIEPFCEVGSIGFTSDSSWSRQRGAGEDEWIVHLTQSIHESNVLLLVDFLDPQSSEEVAKALQAILRSGVQQRDLYLVAICSHERVLRYLLELFPELKIITAKVLLQGDPSSSEVGDLLCF